MIHNDVNVKDNINYSIGRWNDVISVFTYIGKRIIEVCLRRRIES